MLPYRGPVACAALLASAAGCSGDTKPRAVLYPVVNERGLITYSTTDPYDPSVEEERPMVPSQQHQQDDLNRVRQENMRAESMRRNQRQEQFRQEQQDIQAYKDRRNETEQELLSRAQEKQRRAEERQGQWNQQRDQRTPPGESLRELEAQQLNKALQDLSKTSLPRIPR